MLFSLAQLKSVRCLRLEIGRFLLYVYTAFGFLLHTVAYSKGAQNMPPAPLTMESFSVVLPLSHLSHRADGVYAVDLATVCVKMKYIHQ